MKLYSKFAIVTLVVLAMVGIYVNFTAEEAEALGNTDRRVNGGYYFTAHDTVPAGAGADTLVIRFPSRSAGLDHIPATGDSATQVNFLYLQANAVNCSVKVFTPSSPGGIARSHFPTAPGLAGWTLNAVGVPVDSAYVIDTSTTVIHVWVTAYK